MSGTRQSGLNAAKTNKRLYGDDYYVKIGRLGGRASKTGGFGHPETGKELARRAGALGGKVSRRGKAPKKSWITKYKPKALRRFI